LAEDADAKAWSVLWIISAIELTAMISKSQDIAYLALGAMRDPEIRNIAPSVFRNLRELVEGEESDMIAPLTPFMSPQSDSTNALICAISVYVTLLAEMGEESAFRDCYDACICVKRPTSKRVLGWLRAEGERRGHAWPPERVERDYPALCAELV
jgi:hypothetical protein